MRSGRERELFVGCLFWALHAGLLLFLWGSNGGSEPATADEQLFCRWLALPLGYVQEAEWKRTWASLDQAPATVAPVEGPGVQEPGPGLEREPLSHENPFRVQLYGQIRDGRQIVYCFFDTAAQRWFRMVEGETDPESGVFLQSGSEGRAPLLVDLVNGVRYGLLAGEMELRPVEPGKRIKGEREL